MATVATANERPTSHLPSKMETPEKKIISSNSVDRYNTLTRYHDDMILSFWSYREMFHVTHAHVKCIIWCNVSYSNSIIEIMMLHITQLQH